MSGKEVDSENYHEKDNSRRVMIDLVIDSSKTKEEAFKIGSKIFHYLYEGELDRGFLVRFGPKKERVIIRGKVEKEKERLEAHEVSEEERYLEQLMKEHYVNSWDDERIKKQS